MFDPMWSATATGDFNGDAKSDLVWTHAGSGQIAVWLMDGTAVASSKIVFANPAWSLPRPATSTWIAEPTCCFATT